MSGFELLHMKGKGASVTKAAMLQKCMYGVKCKSGRYM
jgi:hypothetical protein